MPSPEAVPVELDQPVLVDTGVWTWVRDRRFPHLSAWFNDLVADGLVLVCDLVVLEMVRLAPNDARAQEIAERLGGFAAVPMPEDAWGRARALQLDLAPGGGHRSAPPTDLLIAAAAESAGVTLLHYDRDYERIASVSELDARWFVPDGSLA